MQQISCIITTGGLSLFHLQGNKSYISKQWNMSENPRRRVHDRSRNLEAEMLTSAIRRAASIYDFIRRTLMFPKHPRNGKKSGSCIEFPSKEAKEVVKLCVLYPIIALHRQKTNNNVPQRGIERGSGKPSCVLKNRRGRKEARNKL